MFNFKKIDSLKVLFSISLLILLPNCAKEKKLTENLTFNELKEQTVIALKEKKYSNAIQPLEIILSQHNEKKELSKYKLMLADSYFHTGNLASAYQMYHNFKEFYPADKKTEYATYQAIKSDFYQTLNVDCDQSITYKTIDLCKKYIKNSNYSKYQKDVEDIEYTCQRKLIDKEVYVYNFYLRKGKIQSAKNRLKYLKENFIDVDPNLKARIVYLEAKLAQKENRDDEVTKKIDLLNEQYPNSQFTRMAQQLNYKRKFIF